MEFRIGQTVYWIDKDFNILSGTITTITSEYCICDTAKFAELVVDTRKLYADRANCRRFLLIRLRYHKLKLKRELKSIQNKIESLKQEGAN